MVNESSEKNFGIIKIYYPLKGFGFISRELGKDLFFHRGDKKWLRKFEQLR